MSNIHIVFRVDSSRVMGSGHLMRCLTLADLLRERGAKIDFICRELAGNLICFIENKGYSVVRLSLPEVECVAGTEDVAHAAWLGVSWQQDAAETIAAMSSTLPAWLIVDHYAIDCRWEGILRPHVGKIMIIDDLADRPHDCDLLLDQNLYQNIERRYESLVAATCNKLLGPKFALLRPEFAAARKNLRQRDGKIKRILVFFGGVDPTNETESTLEVLASLTERQFEVDVVVGGGNQNKKQIQNICAANVGFYYHCQIDNMAQLMVEADLAIGAGGTTTWERCAVGLASIVTAVANNQKELAETGAWNGLLFYLGDIKEHPGLSEKLLIAVKFSLSFSKTIQYYSANGLNTVDAKGANRVANMLCSPLITIRLASHEDCDSIFEWRNAEETRRYIFNSEEISLEAHRNWYYRTLENPDRILLIGEIGDKPVGVLRYDITEHEALISVYLVPGGQGQGVGSQLIRSGSQWVRDKYPYIKIINAEIFRENIASLRAFESAGYKEHHVIFQESL